MEVKYSIYDILEIDDNQYRILAIQPIYVSLVKMGTTKLIILAINRDELTSKIESGEINVIKEGNDNKIFDISSLPKKSYEEYLKRKSVVKEIANLYGPSFLDLGTKVPKPELQNIIKKSGYVYTTVWRLIRRYLQSGCKDVSLIDRRLNGYTSKKSKYQYTKHPGRKSSIHGDKDIVVNDEVEEQFSEALDKYTSGRQKTIKGAYEYMLNKYYSTEEVKDGTYSKHLLPPEKRPSYRQFYYYIQTHLTSEEKDRVKTSSREQRNNKRLLLSDSMKNVMGPGDTIEIDALEADVSLVSELDRSKTVGRGILYLMIDVWTRTILAVSVSFENNSILGLTNLFLNLSDDKVEFAKKYGITFSPELWPSDIIPRRVRVDRGSDFRSDRFAEILNELGVERIMVPAATGSLKGVVEQEFHQFNLSYYESLENNGLIEKRYDSNHHCEATLTISEFTKIVINFVLTHNQKYLENYPLNRKMVKDGVEPYPIKLWNYGCKVFGMPRPIPDKMTYYWTLLTPSKASLSREGIKWKGLYYIADDKELWQEMYVQQNTRKKMDVRYDPRDIGSLYYLRNNELVIARLNPDKFKNSGFAGMSYKEYEDYLEFQKKLKAEGKEVNTNLSIYMRDANNAIINQAQSGTYADPHNMRENRRAEKELVNKENSVAGRIAPESASPAIEEKDSSSEKKNKIVTDDIDFEQAIEEFWERQYSSSQKGEQ